MFRFQPLLKPSNSQAPLYKHTMTPPRCHSTEQCTSAAYEQKRLHKHTKSVERAAWLVGLGKQQQDRKESGAIVEWPYRLSLWQGHRCTLGTHTHAQPHTRGFSLPTRRACRWTRCSSPHPSFQWKLRTSVSPSDAWPAWTWPSGYLEHTRFTSYCFYARSQRFVCKFTANPYGTVAYRWSFPRWRREWLLRAKSSPRGMWPLDGCGFSQRSRSSHLSQFGSWDWQLPRWSSWGESLTGRK